MKTRTPSLDAMRDELIMWRSRAKNAEAENRAVVAERAELRRQLREATETRTNVTAELKDARVALDQIALENRKLFRENETLRRDLAAEQQRHTDARTAHEKGARDVRRDG